VLVAGERDGAQVPDFDYGNSPTQLLADAGRLESQVLVLATSNGTPLIQVAGAGARAVLAGSLPNAGAVTRAAFVLAGEAGCDVTLLAAGGESGRTVEDDYAMAVLASRIGALGAETELIAPISPAADVFKSGPNGQRLAALGYADDVLFCARVAVFENVGVLKAGNFVPWKSG
jgi:2-phosphosulfolactate phosphatase